MTVKFYWICIAILSLTWACQTNPKPSDKGHTAELKADSAQIDSVQNMIYLLLSPNEILNEIFSQKVELNQTLLNPKSNASKYLNVKQKAINLGVYIADFAYLNLCLSKSQTLEYFKIIRDLAQKNNIYGCFDEATFDRIQDNLANNDSLVSISQEMYYNMTGILENANRQNISALITSGTLVEILYLSMQSIEKRPDSRELIQKIFEQKDLFDNFYDFISSQQTDKDVKTVVAQLYPVKQIMDRTGGVPQKTKVTRNSKQHIEVKGGQDVVASEAAFKQLKATINEVRQDFVKVNQ